MDLFNKAKLENKKWEGILYSSFPVSWMNVGNYSFDYNYVKWLKSIEVHGKKMNEKTAKEIFDYTISTFKGKYELEMNAKNFKKGEKDEI